jgi:hypothetical protein
MKMLHNFLNFLPFIIRRRKKEERKEKENFDIIVKGENFHLLCVLSVGKCFLSSSSFFSKSMMMRSERWWKMICSRAHVAGRGRRRRREISLHFPAFSTAVVEEDERALQPHQNGEVARGLRPMKKKKNDGNIN